MGRRRGAGLPQGHRLILHEGVAEGMREAETQLPALPPALHRLGLRPSGGTQRSPGLVPLLRCPWSVSESVMDWLHLRGHAGFYVFTDHLLDMTLR